MKSSVVRGSPDITVKSPPPLSPTQTDASSVHVKSPLSELKHPKTGVTVAEAISKATLDIRSPQMSPKVAYLSASPYDVVASPRSGPGLTPRKSATSGPGLTPRKSAKASPYGSPKWSARHEEEDSDREETIVVIVESNGDGTYSPLRKEPKMAEDEIYRAQFNMEAEINALVKEHPEMGFEFVAQGSLGYNELKGYLMHINDQIGQKDSMGWLEMGLEGFYQTICYLMESIFNVPMKHYFDNLKSKVSNYRALLMNDPAIAKVVNETMPALSAASGQKSTATIILVMIGQIIIGCVAAALAAWKGSAGALLGNTGAAVASSQLDNYLFGNKSLLDAAVAIGKSIFSDKPLSRPKTVVDV